MKQLRNYARVVCLLLILRMAPVPHANASEGELRLRHVIIRSSYREKAGLPPFSRHAFSLLPSLVKYEPYTPELSLSNHSLPEDFPQNIPISWVTRLFGTLSNLFLDERGTLENGIRLYRENRLDEAETTLLSILPSTTSDGERASLWLAWIKYRKNDWESCLVYANSLLKSPLPHLKTEAAYLSALVLIKQNSYSRLLSMMDQLEKTLPLQQWDFRLCYVKLIASTALGQWNNTADFLRRIKSRPFTHVPLYYKLVEIEGMVHYNLGNYQRATERFRMAETLRPTPSYRIKLERNLAWINYFQKRYLSVINSIDTYLNTPLKRLDNETRYLKLACLAQLNRWNEVERLLANSDTKSPFYAYSIFKLRPFVKQLPPRARLRKIISSLSFASPGLKFYTAFHEGNALFKKGDYRSAERKYLRAMSVDINGHEYWRVQYNLGLTHLRLSEFTKAKADFSSLTQQREKRQHRSILYHLLFTHYQLNDRTAFINLLNRSDIKQFDPDQRWEIRFMLGNIQLSFNNLNDARANFALVWKNTRRLPALEARVKSCYMMKKYTEVIQLVERYPNQRSDILFSYYIRSLLGIRHFKQALKKINTRQLKGGTLIRLRLEVWLANRLYSRIIERISPLLNKTLTRENRLLYYLSLGDANFNLKNYSASKNQFYKALSLTPDPQRQSLILYNIALSSYYSNDYASFLRESSLTLKRKELSPTIRYNLTQLVVDCYIRRQQPALADATLKQYIDEHSFQRPKAIFKRIFLLYQAGSYAKCYTLALQQIDNETLFQRRDRLILANYCGETADKNRTLIPLIDEELKKAPTYRKDELTYLLAQRYFLARKRNLSLKLLDKLRKRNLNNSVKRKTSLLAARNLLQLKHVAQAEKELGEIDRYRESDLYVKALHTLSAIRRAQKRPKEAIRPLLKIHYLPTSSAYDKQEALLQVTDIYLTLRQPQKAKTFFDQISLPALSKDKKREEVYLNLKQRLDSALSTKTSRKKRAVSVKPTSKNH